SPQCCLQDTAKSSSPRLSAFNKGEARNEALACGFILAPHYDACWHGRVSRQHSFDLAQFNAEPADLYLIIDATEILNISIRQEACQIARPIHTGTRIGGEGIRNKALGREVRATKVAARQAFPSEVQFTGNADWSWPRVCVQHVDLRVRQWTADRDLACLRHQR